MANNWNLSFSEINYNMNKINPNSNINNSRLLVNGQSYQNYDVNNNQDFDDINDEDISSINDENEESSTSNSILKDLFINEIKLQKIEKEKIIVNSSVRCLIKENSEKEITLFNSCQNIPLIKFETDHLLFSDRKNINKKIYVEELLDIILKKKLFIENNSNNINKIIEAYICQKHKINFFKFCDECKVNICQICKNEEHKNHKISFENDKLDMRQLENTIIHYFKIYNKNKKIFKKHKEIYIIEILYLSIINRLIKERYKMIRRNYFNYNIYENLMCAFEYLKNKREKIKEIKEQKKLQKKIAKKKEKEDKEFKEEKIEKE